jgi:hypothetical protein
MIAHYRSRSTSLRGVTTYSVESLTIEEFGGNHGHTVKCGIRSVRGAQWWAERYADQLASERGAQRYCSDMGEIQVGTILANGCETYVRIVKG